MLRRRHVLGSAVATFLLLGAMAANVWSSPVGMAVSPLLACAPLSVIALTRYGAVRWWGVAGATVAVLGSPLSPAVKLMSMHPPGPSSLLATLLPMIAAHVLVVIVAYLWALRQREIAERHRQELDELARQNEALRRENRPTKSSTSATRARPVPVNRACTSRFSAADRWPYSAGPSTEAPMWASASRRHGSPNSLTSPYCGLNSPKSTANVVLLPAPLRPSSA